MSSNKPLKLFRNTFILHVTTALLRYRTLSAADKCLDLQCRTIQYERVVALAENAGRKMHCKT